MPLFFILGPAGSGKTTLSAAMAQRYDLVHLELDRERGKPTLMDAHREEWRSLMIGRDPGPMAQAMRMRAAQAGAGGAVLSFPCFVVPGLRVLSAAQRQGIATVALYGTGAECLQSFLARERASGRNMGESHWRSYNAQSYAHLSSSRYDAYRIDAFERGRHRDLQEVMADAWRRRIASDSAFP